MTHAVIFERRNARIERSLDTQATEDGVAEIIGLGLTHYPALLREDVAMSGLFRRTLDDPDMPPARRLPANWPAAMQAEWRLDGESLAAAAHRQRIWAGLTRLRGALDDFRPDVVVIWGDDQYENFREDIIPAYCVLAYDEIVATPWRSATNVNFWGEPPEREFHYRGARDVALGLVTDLLEDDFDVAYAYEPLHEKSLPHAFLNALLLLDHERRGFPYPVLPIALNCYGRRVVSFRGRPSGLGERRPFDPPSPRPRRLFDLGRAVARSFAGSSLRVALVASSSWSHAFLNDRSDRLHPDVQSDRRLYEHLVAGAHDEWANLALTDIEAAGQQEILNWVCLVGAMEELGARLAWSDFVETYIFNSNKVLAEYGSVTR